MKVLYLGGQKSGKSRLAEQKALLMAKSRPVYLATSEAFDEGMRQRIALHRQNRSADFTTIEEPLHLQRAIQDATDVVLVECLTLWLNNMLHYGQKERIFEELHGVLSLERDMVFVLNDIGGGIVPPNELAREFIDLSGSLSQLVAAACDEVYFVRAGLALRMK